MDVENVKVWDSKHWTKNEEQCGIRNKMDNAEFITNISVEGSFSLCVRIISWDWREIEAWYI